MEKTTLQSGKTVLISEPYRPAEAMLPAFVGRDRELKMIAAAWIGGGRFPPLSPLLVGEPGVGKNRLVYELSRQTALPLYILQGHEDVTAEDLACAVRFADDGTRGMEYVLSPLVTAMLHGGICFIDEIGKIRPRALALLVSVLDERRYIDSTLLGERVHAKPGFRFVAATNTGECNGLPEFVRSRMRPVVEVGHPPKEEIDEIVSRHLEGAPNTGDLLDAFWDLWGGAKHPPTPRDAIHQFALASSLSDLETAEVAAAANGGGPHRLLSAERSPESAASLKPDHLRDAFERLFPKGTE